MKYWTSGDIVTANDLNLLLVSEEYANHLGSTDNFIQIGISGNGAVSSNTTTHEMFLFTGIANNGHAAFYTKNGYPLTANPIVINVIYKSWQAGNSGVDRYGVKIGLYDHFTSEEFAYDSQGAYFEFQGIGAFANWDTITTPAAGQRMNSIDDLIAGDLLTIIATSSKVQFYKNGILLTTHTDYLPITSSMNIGVIVQTDGAGDIGQSMNTGVDFIGLKR